MTFYFSYSYHYRLGFAVWPLLCLPSAIGLAHILDRDRIQRWRAGFRRAYHVVLLAVCLPGTIAVASNEIGIQSGCCAANSTTTSRSMKYIILR